MNRLLVPAAIATATLLVLTPAAIASPRSNHDDHRHQALTSRSDFDRDGRGSHRRDGVWSFYNHRDNEDAEDFEDDSDGGGGESGDVTEDDSDTTAGDVVGSVAGSPVPTVLSGAEQRMTFRITGFGKIDNSPPGSTEISQGVIHTQAGGTGTFSDALTAASPGSAGSTEFPKGTKFYVPHISRYVIIEDSGASKFDQPHLDIWSGTTDNVEDCESKITGTFEVIKNPKAGYPVKAGPIATGSGCNI